MAAKDKFGKASEAAKEATGNRYVQRLIEDEDLRANLLSAYGAARSAYGRMSNGKPATEALFEDKKLHAELGNVIGSLREATGSLREPPAKATRRRGGIGRSLMLAAVGGALAIALNKGLRTKVLDLIFGAEEKFDYSSTTAPSAAAEPAGMASA
jgi:uncharacterized membrane protein YccC